MWERESQYIDLHEGIHRITLVEPGVPGAKPGEPSRYILQIEQGSGPFEAQVGKHKIRIKLGGDFTVDENGALVDNEGNVFDVRAFEKQMITKLNEHHDLLRRVAIKHHAGTRRDPRL